MLNFYTQRTLPLLAVILSFALFSPALAQPPDAGRLLQEQRQIQPSLPDRLPEKDAQDVEQAPLTDSGVKITVKGFRFSGGQGMVTDAELLKLVQDAVGKELGFTDLQHLTAKITNYLRKKGYILARAYLPKQDITKGIIEIAIIAGRIEGKTRINIKEPRHISQKLLEGIAERSLPEGKPVRLENIERAVLLMNDLPGIKSQASLERGDAPGTTRVVINATEGNLLSGSLSGDNFGDRYTGAWRGTGRAALNDPFGLGDQLSVSLTGAEHLFQGNVAYALPLGATGVNWSVAYTALTYELGGDLANLKAKGNGQTISTGLTYPLLRTRNASLWSALGYEYLSLHDEAGGVTIRDRRLSVGNLNLSGSFFDGFGGGGLTGISLAGYYGNLHLSGAADIEGSDDATARSSGNFSKVNYSLGRLQRITRLLSVFGFARGQLSGNNLDSSQKIILGGPNGIRAYPVGEAAGDEGLMMTLEPRIDLPFSPSWAFIQLIGFVDAGYVTLHKNPWTGSVTNASDNNNYWLSGAGAGINVGKAGLYSIRASYARKINDNPGRNASGYDADNLNDYGRFWLQAAVWF